MPEYSDVIRLSPNDADAHYNLALALTNVDKLDEAIAELSEALRITPELRMIIYGAVLLVLVFMFPQGLAPLLEKAMDFLSRIGLAGTEEKSHG